MALALRLHGFNWDDGQNVHPDERFIGSSLTGKLIFPSSPLDLFNPDSGWNPAVAASDTGVTPINGVVQHNPAGFNYGSLPLYLIYIFAHVLSWLARIFPWWSSWRNATSYPDIVLAGRVLSAFGDTLTVFLVYLIGARLAGKQTGLYAAALATFAVLSIQLAHFTTVDALLTTFATGTLLACIDLFTHGRPRDYAIAGVWLAAAVATKASAVPLVAVVVAAYLWRQGRQKDPLDWRTLTYPALTILAAVVALFIFQPYTFVDWTDFWTGVQGQNDLARGTQLVFYTRKWAGTTPIVYPFQQLTVYSLGLPLAFLAFAGLIYEGVRVFTPKRNAGALVGLFVVVYFVSAGMLYMKYLRYMEPIVPSLCVLAALLVSALARNRVWLVGMLARPLGYTLGGTVLLLTACYGLAYEHIYAQPNTHVQASCWLFKHVPAGTPVAQDAFDETIPLNVCGGSGGIYPTAGGSGMPPYGDPDTAVRVQLIAGVLNQAQYYFILGRRAIDTFSAQPRQFPYYHHFYQLLLGTPQGRQDPLGYTLVKTFIEHPKLGPWTLDESGANQNFYEYDHPPVYIFKNTGHRSIEALAMTLTGNGSIAAPALYATPPKSLLLTPKQIATNQHSPSYGQMFPDNSIPMRLPILVWLLMIEIVGLLALPISMRIFSRLRDCGFVIAKTAGILLLSYFSWILASLHVAEYSRIEIALCLLPLAAISLLWGVHPRDILPIVRARRVPILLTEAVFLLGFGAFVYIRMLYPDLWHQFSGGEKTMDFSFLNAIVRSRVMPPYDPWFGGGYLNYYYYGHFTVATLLKLAGIAPVVAVNLAIPTFFALALATCVSLAYTLVGRVPYALLGGVFAMLSGNLVGAQVLVSDLQAASPTHDRLQPVTSAGSDLFLLGGIVTALSFAWSLITGVVRGTLAVVLGIWQVLFGNATMPQYAFDSGWPWDGSRVLDDHKVITEFPYWTFLFADPHAHMWDVPFVLCVLGIAFTFVSRAGTASEPAVEASRAIAPGARYAVWPVMGAIIGAIGPTNPWDLATVLGALALAMCIGRFLCGGSLLRALGAVIARMAVLAGFALGFYAPFYQHFQSFYSSIGLTVLRHQTSIGDFFTVFGFLAFVLISYLIYAVLVDTNTGYWLRSRIRAALFTMYYWDIRHRLNHYFAVVRHMGVRDVLPTVEREVVAPRLNTVALMGAGLALPFFIVHYWAAGVVVAIGVLATLLSLARDPHQPTIRRRQWAPGAAVQTVLGIGGVLLLVLLIANYWVLALLTGMIALAILLLVDQRRPQPTSLYCLHLLIVVGLGVVAAGELVYVRDFYDGDPLLFRTNTIFKLYEEAWLMMGVAGAAGLARLLAPLLAGAPRRLAGAIVPTMGLVATGNLQGRAREREHTALGKRSGPSGWAWSWLAVLMLLFIGVEIYPLRMTPLRVNERQTWDLLQNTRIGPTLDGSTFIQYVDPADYAAIKWLNQTIPGSPIVLQSRHGGYRDFAARVTMFTGLPSVVNWDGEAKQQRYSLQPAGAGRSYPDQVSPRVDAVDLMYSTTDIPLALQLLHTYHVSYIYVGYYERHGNKEDGDYPYPYPKGGLAKFDRMVTSGLLQSVYNQSGVTIYRVVR